MSNICLIMHVIDTFLFSQLCISMKMVYTKFQPHLLNFLKKDEKDDVNIILQKIFRLYPLLKNLKPQSKMEFLIELTYLSLKCLAAVSDLSWWQTEDLAPCHTYNDPLFGSATTNEPRDRKDADLWKVFIIYSIGRVTEGGR